MSDNYKTVRNVKRKLKGYKPTKCSQCNNLMYVKGAGTGRYTCWPCILKYTPKYFKEHAPEEVKKWLL